MLTALVVLVTAIGGPQGIHRSLNAPALGLVTEVTKDGSGGLLTATSSFGDLELRVPRGSYTILARIEPGTHPCGPARHVQVGARPKKVHLFCGIK